MNDYEKTREELIEELKQARRQLKGFEPLKQRRDNVEERFRLAMEACRDGVWDWDIETGEVYYSPGYTGMLGYREDEFPAHVTGWSDLIHPDDLAEVEAANRDCIENRTERFGVEFRMQRKDGHWLWILGRGQAVSRGEDGTARRMVGTHTDISRLKASESRFNTISETAISAIVTIDMQGYYTSWNSAWCDMLGYSHEEMERVNAFDVTHPDDVAAGVKNVNALVNGEIKGYRQTKRFIRKDGSILWADLSASALRNHDGEIEDLLGVIIDISEQKKTEWAVREGEERYRTMIESMSSGVAVYKVVDGGMDFVFMDFNSAAEKITHLNRADVLGKKMLSLFPQMEASGLPETLRRVWKSGEPEKLAPFYYQDEARTGWRENRVYRLPSGEVVALFDDVTERIEETRARKASEQRLELAMLAVDDAVWDWNIKTGDTYFSPRWYTMLGYEPYELPQSYKSWEQLLHPDDRSRALRQVMKHLKSGGSFTVEMRMRTKNGTWRSIMGRGMVVEVDDEGQPVRMIGTHVDITKRVDAMNALRESEQRFRSLLEDVHMVAVRGYDEDLKVIFWNRASEELYGYSKDEVRGGTFGELLLDEDSRQEVRKQVLSSFQEGKGFPAGELVVRHKDGTAKSVYSSHVLQQNSLGRKELYFVDVDLTGLKLAASKLIEAKEQAEAANRAKSMFLANMSHELRTPLNGIIGMHHVLASSGLNEDQENHLALAQVSAKRLTALLNEILDLTRIEAGRMELKSRPFTLSSLLEDTTQLFEASGRGNSVSCTFTLDPALPDMLDGDSSRLRQILNNLVGNAIKFTEAGSVELFVDLLESGKEDECRILFRVKDTGAGIPDDMLDLVFNSFTQGDTRRSRNHQGAGLGLSIVRELVILMGGCLCVSSSLGEGTTFYCSLPFGVHREAPAADRELPVAEHKEMFAVDVLLVEDDPISRQVMMKLLENLGCNVTSAENGNQALDKLRKARFDAVFMDVQMPLMDGVSATRAIRGGEAGESARDTVIVALTAYAMSGDRERLLDAGMDEYIEKPVAPEAVQAVLSRM